MVFVFREFEKTNINNLKLWYFHDNIIVGVLPPSIYVFMK